MTASIVGPFTFQQLVNMVYTETNRPDLVAETQQAVFEATLSCHLSDFYLNDIQQAQITFTNADYIQQIETSSLPAYRNFAFFRKAVPGPTLFQPMSGSTSDPLIGGTDPLTGDPVPPNYCFPLDTYVYLKELDIDNLIDGWGYEYQDVWYFAGGNINIKSSTQISNGQIGWYAFPILDIANGGLGYNSWIANNFPFAIIYRAAGTVFQKIGQDSAIKQYMDPQMGLAVQQLALLKMSSIKGTGY
jgi:hypothetical protein